MATDDVTADAEFRWGWNGQWVTEQINIPGQDAADVYFTSWDVGGNSDLLVKTEMDVGACYLYDGTTETPSWYAGMRTNPNHDIVN